MAEGKVRQLNVAKKHYSKKVNELKKQLDKTTKYIDSLYTHSYEKIQKKDKETLKYQDSLFDKKYELKKELNTAEERLEIVNTELDTILPRYKKGIAVYTDKRKEDVIYFIKIYGIKNNQFFLLLKWVIKDMYERNPEQKEFLETFASNVLSFEKECQEIKKEPEGYIDAYLQQDITDDTVKFIYDTIIPQLRGNIEIQPQPQPLAQLPPLAEQKYTINIEDFQKKLSAMTNGVKDKEKIIKLSDILISPFKDDFLNALNNEETGIFKNFGNGRQTAGLFRFIKEHGMRFTTMNEDELNEYTYVDFKKSFQKEFNIEIENTTVSNVGITTYKMLKNVFLNP